MAGTVNGGNSPIRDYMLGVNRLAKDLKNDEARAAVLGGAVDRMAKSPDADPSLRDLASRMKEIVAPSSGTAAPLQDARITTALLQATVNAAIHGMPLGAGVVLALAAQNAVGQEPTGEGASVLHRTLEQIAPQGEGAPTNQAALLAQVTLAGSERAGGEAVHINLAGIQAIADLNTPVNPKSDALVNEQLMFCQGKSPERVLNDVQRRLERFDTVIGTKANSQQFQALFSDPALQGRQISFDEASKVLTVNNGGERAKKGLIVQIVGGPEDLPVAQEAGSIAEAMGNRVERISAEEIHDRQELLQSANVVLTMCGTDPNLPNAVAALTDKPVIAMPTKEGFGEGLEGAQKLIALMQNASEGVSFVNIENGFGAAYVADKINRAATNPETTRVGQALGKWPSDFVVVTTAGTADIPVAEAAALAAEALGQKVVRLYDHGVNDPDGLKEIEEAYRQASAVIVAAGLEGGLPNHVAAVTQSPVIAVPTSVGYGTGRGGVAAMLCALNACAPGITVVGIDAAVSAAMVAHKMSSRNGQGSDPNYIAGAG